MALEMQHNPHVGTLVVQWKLQHGIIWKYPVSTNTIHRCTLEAFKSLSNIIRVIWLDKISGPSLKLSGAI